MFRHILIGGMLIALVSCSTQKKESFTYQQNFSCDSSKITEHLTRLVFEDVREETKLSNWNKANWILIDNGVKVVGSRRNEIERRIKLIRDIYKGDESFSYIREFRVPWLTLSMGSQNWCDYSVSSSIQFEKECIAGIAFRYLNSREYYAFILDAERNKITLVLRKIDKEATAEKIVWDELTTSDYQFTKKKKYDIEIEVDGEEIICKIEDKKVIEFEDDTRKNGKIALIADDQVTFGPVSVVGKMLIPEKIVFQESSQPTLVYDLPLPGGDIERDFYFLDPDSDGEKEIIIAERKGDDFAYRCLEFDGKELWKIENIQNPTTESGDYTLQIFDINNDGKNEIVTAIDFQLQIRNGKNAKLLKSVSTPKPNPYYDSRDYKYPQLLGDAICPVSIKANEPPGFYIKDRYTNIWMYDHNLIPLWHKAMSTSHFPLPVDLDEDGVDEILVNHTLMKADGSIIWELPLSDHVDNISYVSLNPGKEPKYFYLAGGEMGLLKVDPYKGEILKRLELGHIQTITIADFLPEKEGLELLSQTLWREDQIHYLFDKDLNLLSTWQGSFGRIFPIPWGINGSELALTPDGIVDPLSGKILHPSFGKVLNVLADNRWGNVLVVTEEENHLRIYSPKDLKVKPEAFLYSEIQSHYLPVIKTALRK